MRVLWATVNAHVADIVPSHSLATGVAVVLGGATLGTVIGVPLASFVAQGWDWRVAFGALAVLGGVAAVLVRAVVTSAVASASTDEHAATPVGRLRPVLVVAGLVGLVLVGHFAAFTFVTRLVATRLRGYPASSAGRSWCSGRRPPSGSRSSAGCGTGGPRRRSSGRRSSWGSRCSP